MLSEVALAEAKLSQGRSRPLTPLEKIGLFTVLPILTPRRYTKNDRQDYRSILSNRLPTTAAKAAKTLNINDESKAAIVLNLVTKRQQQVHRMMVCRAAGLIGAIALPVASSISLRHYGARGMLLPAPALTYAGNLIGRGIGAVFTGRMGVTLYDVSVGNLPGKQKPAECV